MYDGDLPSFAYNFLRTRDCFVYASSQTRIQARLTFSLPSASIIGEVVWHVPAIDFDDFPDTLNTGAAVHLEYRSPTYGNQCGFVVFPDYMNYKIDDDISNLLVKCVIYVHNLCIV